MSNRERRKFKKALREKAEEMGLMPRRKGYAIFKNKTINGQIIWFACLTAAIAVMMAFL